MVLPRYGFEGSPKALAAVIAPWQSHSRSLQGVFDMLQQFDRPEITSNAEFQQQAGPVCEHTLDVRLNVSLASQAASWFATK